MSWNNQGWGGGDGGGGWRQSNLQPHYRNEMSQECHEVKRNGCCFAAKMTRCRLKKVEEGRTVSLEEAGQGATEKAPGTGGTDGMVSGATPKKEEKPTENEEEKEIAEARQMIEQRLDMGALGLIRARSELRSP